MIFLKWRHFHYVGRHRSREQSHMIWLFVRIMFLTNFCRIKLGWTAWPIWKNRKNSFKERWKKVKKSAKNEILQKKSKSTREANYLKYDV